MTQKKPDKPQPKADPGTSQPNGPDWQAYFKNRAESAKDPRLKKFYACGTFAADTPVSELPFVALDLETTGLDAQKHGIVSIGLVPFSIRRIRCAHSRYWVLRPRRELDQGSVPFHHITHSDLLEAPDLNEILDELLAALAGRVVVVHYRGIERPFLRRAVRDRLGEPLEFPLIDTMELEARVYRRRHWARRFLAGLVGRKPQSIRLAQSRSRYKLPQYGAHHALTDALATAELLQAQIAWRYGPDTPLGELWC
ncbi:MAG: 3'-5' exonuclease [Wenzhouxiangellaceae bacterium]|nr:3'-5' exonuclease [Wenzhouxiangellaceae bacterium]